MIYHIMKEDTIHITVWDSYLANAVLIWFVILLMVSMSLCPDRELTWLTLILFALALAFYMTAFYYHGEDEFCLHWRLHPMWHLIGYGVIGLVLLNFNKSWVKTHSSLLSKKPWLRELQKWAW